MKAGEFQREGRQRHLSYCLNVHPGEGWGENLEAIRKFTLPIRDLVAANKPFGLGLRIAHQAACELSASEKLRREAKAFFDQQKLYAFTINGFPYGRFHRGRVKEQVYAPDWRSAERLEYTKQLALILADWLPEGEQGSISTVPCSFKPWITTRDDLDLVCERLCQAADFLGQLYERTGRLIHLGLEPEPCCFLETTAETVDFFEKVLPQDELVRRHIGVCLDTCHVALQFENPASAIRAYQRAGILISKVQLSAALSAQPTAQAASALKPFCEPVYFHQVKALRKEGVIDSWHDLPDALDQMQVEELEELRVHFHLPLFFEGNQTLASTARTMDGEFFDLLGASTDHLEIETYTFDVLPPELREAGIVQSIAEEFRWVGKRLSGVSPNL